MAFSVVRCLACESFEAIAEAQGNAELRASLTTPPDAAQALVVTAAGVNEGCICLSGHAVTPLAPLPALLGDRVGSTYIETPVSMALDVGAPPIRPPIA
jgi:hypothetical protein